MVCLPSAFVGVSECVDTNLTQKSVRNPESVDVVGLWVGALGGIKGSHSPGIPLNLLEAYAQPTHWRLALKFNQ